MGIVEVNYVTASEGVSSIGGAHQYIGAILLFLGNPKLVACSTIVVCLKLLVVAVNSPFHFNYTVAVHHTADDDFPVLVGDFPSLGFGAFIYLNLNDVVVACLSIL